MLAQLDLLIAEALGAAPVLDVGIEGDVGATAALNSLIVSRNAAASTPSSLCASSSSVSARHLGDLPDAVLVAQQVRHLAVEDLPGELAGCSRITRAVLGVGVVAEVGALVDEALAVGVDA